ncbi:MAG: hypothetical protein LBQ20_05865 [Rhodanobacter sp.]|nr:hypothetical protein [Rhodanobacter sp.]
MKKIVIITMALIALQIGTATSAQNTSMRGNDPLAAEATDAQDVSGDAHAAPGDRSDNDGGGTVRDTHTPRGNDGRSMHAAHDGNDTDSHTTAKTIPSANPVRPVAVAPRHLGYRWQSLIPGALK